MSIKSVAYIALGSRVACLAISFLASLVGSDYDTSAQLNSMGCTSIVTASDAESTGVHDFEPCLPHYYASLPD